MFNLLLKIVQRRLAIIRAPALTSLPQSNILVLGEDTDIGSRLVKNQLDESHEVYERIKHVEKQISQEKIEVGVIFDTLGNITAVRKGTVSSVIFSRAEEELAVGHTVTHNHPHLSYFSDIDLSFAHKINLQELRAVVGNKVHRLVRPTQGWNFEPVEELWDSLERKVKHRRDQKQISAAQAEKDYLKIGELVTRKLSLFIKPENL